MAIVWHVVGMLIRLTIPAAIGTVMALFAISCTDKGGGGRSSIDHPVGTGPFNHRGDYVEAWADNPAKWRGGDRKPTPPRTSTPAPSRPAPAVASTQRPPQQTASRPPQQTASRPPQQTASRPATTQPRPQPRPAAQTKRYTVKKGDTLGAIARRHNTTVPALRRANGISGDLIRVGQVLRIP